MRGKIAVLAGVVLLVPSLAHPGGFDIAWGNSCWLDNPVSNQSFACTSNIGSNRMTVAFIPDAPKSDFAGAQVTVSIDATSASLPSWWSVFNTGSCRQTSLVEGTDFTPFTPVACVDVWEGQAGSGIVSYKTQANDVTVPANGARVTAVAAMTIPTPIDPSQEYLAFWFSLNHVKTTGTGSCAGCATPVTLTVTNFQYGTNQALTNTLTSAIHNGCLTWQGGGGGPCGAVPARNLTWGRVQSLYR